ncbi:MAG: hypothetical protein Q7W45_11385 [Bacteroidota bacterium]|nr:hypothetical protein [Bacteroidota bacterium]MDP3147072.1 hypothetical protein [Bacteroidota bacterium]
MKNIKSIALLLISTCLIFSCKKKETTETPQVTNTTPVPPAHVSSMTAKVNAVDWSMASDQYGPFTYLSKSGISRGFGGQNSFTAPYSVISLNFYCTVGTYTLSNVGNYSARYSVGSTIYNVNTGTINITSIDTSGVKSPFIDKFKCTFSFITDTIGNQSYNITNGIVDFEK